MRAQMNSGRLCQVSEPPKDPVRVQQFPNALRLPNQTTRISPNSENSWNKSILFRLGFDKNIFENNTQGALNQIELGCKELSNKNRLTSQEMNEQLDYLKGFIDASKHSDKAKAKMYNWVNTLRGMEGAKTSFESEKHTNLGSDAGVGIQKDMLSRRFDYMLTGQNGKYSSRLTETQVELMGS
ncbi:MAG: hypothetical protein ACO201_03940 [Rickettsiales bacterium]